MSLEGKQFNQEIPLHIRERAKQVNDIIDPVLRSRLAELGQRKEYESGVDDERRVALQNYTDRVDNLGVSDEVGEEKMRDSVKEYYDSRQLVDETHVSEDDFIEKMYPLVRKIKEIDVNGELEKFLPTLSANDSIRSWLDFLFYMNLASASNIDAWEKFRKKSEEL